MDHPFRGLPENCPPHPSLPCPQSLSYFSLPRHDPSGSRHPPTPPPALPCVPVPGPFPARSDPVRKITPPEEKRIHTENGKIAFQEEEVLATAKEYKSPYDKAYAYVQEFSTWRKGGSVCFPLEFYEESHAIKMSKQDWFKLSTELNLEESDGYPRLSYNAFTSILIIQCMPSPVHQSIGSIIGKEFILSQANLSRDLRRQTVLTWEQDCRGFGGPWLGSKKKPDLAIKVLNADGEYNIKFVLEAGLSESYDQLVEDAQLWLEGMDEVSMVILVKFVEVPKYGCPVAEDQDPEELGIPLDPQAIRMKDVTLEEDYGPAAYKGLNWVGKIIEAYMETWARGVNGKAVKRGNRRNLMQGAHSIIDMRDFLPQGYPQTISLDLDDFRDLLKVSIKELAAERCKEAVVQYRKRMGEEPGDGDCQP